MSVEPALGVLDPALQRYDGAIAGNDMAGDVHFARLDEYRAGKIGGGFM
jgi:hypothetical protein